MSQERREITAEFSLQQFW